MVDATMTCTCLLCGKSLLCLVLLFLVLTARLPRMCWPILAPLKHAQQQDAWWHTRCMHATRWHVL